MSVLDRASLEQSPLADLHALASELSLDGYRRLRKPELIDAILERQGGEPTSPAEASGDGDPDGEPAARRRRGRRGGRGRGTARQAPAEELEAEPAPAGDEDSGEDEPRDAEPAAEELVEGVVDLLPNGSGFVRVNPPEPSDEDVYISSAQVKRCELVPGDRVSGPRRPPRRSERFASLSRVDTINGRPASEVAGGVRFEELPAAFASARFTFEGDDPLLAAIDSAAPVGRGSRVTIVGPSQSGKSSLLRNLAEQLARQEELTVWLVLTGIRPEEVFEWRSGPLEPAVALALGASPEAQGQAVEAVIEQARRVVARGAHGAVLIDTLDSLPPHTAAKALGSARNVVEGGTLTVIATASLPHGGETTVVALGRGADGSPTIDRDASWTMRADRFAG